MKNHNPERDWSVDHDALDRAVRAVHKRNSTAPTQINGRRLRPDSGAERHTTVGHPDSNLCVKEIRVEFERLTDRLCGFRKGYISHLYIQHRKTTRQEGGTKRRRRPSKPGLTAPFEVD